MSLSVDIRKNFGDFALNVQFEAGNEVIALLGASGCGKSMTLKCIAGIVKPDSGTIIADGRVFFDSKKKINLPPQERSVGMLFQNYALWPNMTVRENLLAVLTRAKKVKDAANRLRSILERFYLIEQENLYPPQLSGGQQQRAALARIMAAEPAIIMLDEPLSALDSYLRWQLELELAQTLDDFGGTALFVSHNRDEVYRMCGKVCPMADGSARGVYGTKELFAAPDSLAACLLSGCKNYSRAEKRGCNLLYAVDWQTELTCAAPVPDDILYIGVRAHYLTPTKTGGRGNVVRCRVLRVIDDLFSIIIMTAPRESAKRGDFSRIRMELAKPEAEGIKTGDHVDIVIKPEDIILLSK